MVILESLRMQDFLLIIIITAFLIILDAIGTVVNARLYREYYKLETLPWSKFFYKSTGVVGGFILSLLVNLGTVVVFFISSLRIAWVPLLLGFWTYRLWHTCLRLWYWRGSLFGGGKNG